MILAYLTDFLKFHNKVKVKKNKHHLPFYLLYYGRFLFTLCWIYTSAAPRSHAHIWIIFFFITPTAQYFVHATIRKLIRHPFAIFIIHRSCLKWTNGFSVKISLNIQFYRAFSTIHHRNKLVIFSLNIITSGDYRIGWIQQRRLSMHFKDLDNSGQTEILSSFYLQFDLLHR